MLWNVPETGEPRTSGERGKLLAVAGTFQKRQKTILTTLSLGDVRPCPEQPRKFFAPEKLEELATSIKARGLLQPIVVRRLGEHYELLAGERRYRAAQLAGIDRLPALIREGDDPLEIALIENLQREDLSPLEEAEALATLIERHGYSHREVGDLLGKSRPYVSNMLALVKLPDEVKGDLQRDGCTVPRELLMGVARQSTPESAVALWRRVRLDSLSVRRFRAERSGERTVRSPGDDVIYAARRLNRAIRKLLKSEGSIQEREVAIARVLKRTTRLVSRQLLVLSAAHESPPQK